MATDHKAYMRTYRARNRDALRAYDRARGQTRRGDPDKTRESARAYQRRHRYRRYGTSEAEVEATRARQDNRCALCGVEFVLEGPDARVKGCAQVDHCHETLRLRGLLCSGCNTGLGALGDNETGLLRALAYVRGEPTVCFTSEGPVY